MKYMGSKRRIAKYILPIILKDRKPNQWYVEPFVGGANMIDKVDGNRIGADSNEYLIELLLALQKGWKPPLSLSEKEYKNIKNNKNNFEKHLVGYVGIVLSYGSKWFGGYMRGKNGKGIERDYRLEGYNNVIKQVESIKGITFKNCSYDKLSIPENSIIYCDSPYRNTEKYKAVGDFNHEDFWQWCRDKAKEGHQVFISEYNAPDDFVCLWSKEIVSSLTKDTGSKKVVEKLFTYCI